MKKLIVVAPHPDDETLGCGGTLLFLRDQGFEIHWLIISSMKQNLGFSQQRILCRKKEIKKVAATYKFASFSSLDFPTSKLDSIPKNEIIEKIGQVFEKIQPNIIFVPFDGDVHSDHRIVFEATIACTKWFRHRSVHKILAYETLSETDFGLSSMVGFRPSVFYNIELYFAKKCEILKLYEGEMGLFPFPRSFETLEALARLRGSAAGFKFAEAFQLLKEING